jgi:hypothetical protein
MNIEKIRFKKIGKLLILLLTSVLIAMVSADFYNEMYMKSDVGVDVAAKDLQFKQGANFTVAGGWINTAKTVVTFDLMTGGQGVNKTYYEPANITNTGGSDHDFEMKFDSWTLSNSSALDYITIAIYDKDDNLKGNMIHLPGDLSGTNTTGDVTITASADWRIEWIIRWVSDADSGETVDVTLILIVKS